jgi:hypothetical protein
MENGKRKMEILPSFSIIRFPFSVISARASAFMLYTKTQSKGDKNNGRLFTGR